MRAVRTAAAALAPTTLFVTDQSAASAAQPTSSAATGADGVAGHSGPFNKQVVGYFTQHQNLRGVMVWSLDGDTSNGQLTTALGNSLGVNVGEGDRRQ
jgi:hypothetical protein